MYLREENNMIKLKIKRILCVIFVAMFFLSATVVAFRHGDNRTLASAGDDLDPLVDLAVTVTIKEIRTLDKIDFIGDPDFYVKLFVNGVESMSPIWHDQRYVIPNWSATQDVPDTEENVSITIQLWDWNFFQDKLCDISPNSQSDPLSYDVELIYSLKTGHWRGDDYVSPELIMFDRSGYGRLNGCDDNSIYQMDKDCEIWFDISQNDYDGDTVPYWTEVNVYGTDPEANDTGRDDDEDGVPIEWEHKWGYDPFVWDNHAELDPDVDGLQNIEEYLTSRWDSDPFRQDIFFEIDGMEIGPNGEGESLPDLTKDLLKDAFSKHNIIYHIDDGCMGGGGELVPFDLDTTRNELQQIYMEYFMHNDTNNWRRGVFHYAIFPYHAVDYCGFTFATTIDNETYRINSYQISTGHMVEKVKENSFFWTVRQMRFNMFHCKQPYVFNKEYRQAAMYASAMMHESGHSLGIFASNMPGCDNYETTNTFSKTWFEWRNYKSCMNYGYAYALVDYSDGSHGINDFDDWAHIDLTMFQRDIMWH